MVGPLLGDGRLIGGIYQKFGLKTPSFQDRFVLEYTYRIADGYLDSNGHVLAAW